MSVALGALLLLAACQSAPTHLPASISTRPTAEHKRVPGTHVLLAAPATFQLEKDAPRLRLNEVQFVEVRELAGTSMADYVARVEEQLRQLKDKLPADALQSTTFNGQPAIFLTQPHDQIPGLETAILAFGDSLNVTLLIGVYPRLIGKAREVTHQILLTAYPDPKLVEPGSKLDFSFDVRGSGFRPVGRRGRWMVYLPEQLSPADSLHASLIRITTLPPVADTVEVQDLALSLIREYRAETEMDNVEEANTRVNGHYAYRNGLTFHYKELEGKALVVLISTPQGVLVFDGRAFDQADKRLAEYEQLVKRLHIGQQPPA